MAPPLELPFLSLVNELKSTISFGFWEARESPWPKLLAIRSGAGDVAGIKSVGPLRVAVHFKAGLVYTVNSRSTKAE